jgi:aspartyl-tRNA(Asn)/glutamyl-tRNA(Gln) amidotransferase subunit A
VAGGAAALAFAGPLVTAEAWGTWRDTIEGAPERMFPPILDRFRGGASVAAHDFVSGWRQLRRLRAEWAEAVAGFDAVILPTAAILPPDAGRLLADPAYYAVENLLALRNTRIGNMLGLCALTLPTDEPSCGIMFLGAAGGDLRLLRLGAAAEAALA